MPCARYSCRILTKIEVSRQTYQKCSNMKCHENPSIWSRVVPCGRTDRLDEANSRFCVPLGRPRRRWEDNIKMDLQEVGGSCGDWMELAEDRGRWRALVSTVRNLRVPKMRGISGLAAEPVSFSRRTLLHGVSK